jgi:hypothetical protein
MASPHVAASAAYLHSWGINHPESVRTYLKRSAIIPTADDEDDEDDEDPSSSEDNDRYGSGIIQAGGSLKSGLFHRDVLRLGFVLIFALGLFFLARERDYFRASAPKTGLFLGTALWTCLAFSPLFLLFYEAGISMPGFLKWAAVPFPEWDLFLGANWHQNPITVSALLPALAIFLCHSQDTLKYVAAGFAVGIASFDMVELLSFSDVIWIPGIYWWDRAFLLVNAGVCLGLAYLTLKGELKNYS